MKHYKQFHEIDNNRYYTIDVDDEIYIGTESILKLHKNSKFKKQDILTMGFKLLKLSAPIAILFNALDDLKPIKNQKYDSEDLIIYNFIDNKKVKETIKDSYTKAIEDETTKKLNLLADAGIDLVEPIHTGNNIVKAMLRSNLNHLYTERVNAFTNNIYLYEQDCFGTLIIYRIINVKGFTKTIDTFIYNKEVIGNLLKTLYEEGR